jgi:DNA-directed RNA polymerase subunit RPC12/RpoP
MTEKTRAKCPLCEVEIEVPLIRLGYEFSCPECKERIIIKQLSPLVLDFATEEEEEEEKFEKM